MLSLFHVFIVSYAIERKHTMSTRTEKLNELEQKLQQGVAEFFTSDRYAQLLLIMSKFHSYSFNNCLLIAMQCPHASYVTGYSNWKTSFNRIVRKGEKAIRIIAPCPYKSKDKDTGEEKEQLYFRTASVFDVSQTMQIPETEEIPLGLAELTGTVADYDKLLEAIISVSPVPVFFEDIPGEAKGYFSETEGKIVIKQGMSQAATLKTACHELTHACLHNSQALGDEKRSRETKEIEAESTAFMLCNLLGVDSSDYTFEYVAGWEGKDNMKALTSSMNLIKTTANDLFDAIQQKLAVQVA